MDDLTLTVTAAPDEDEAPERRPDIPENTTFDAEILGLKKIKKPYKNDDGSDVFRLEWRFLLDDPGGPQDGRKIYGETGVKLSLHPNCKLTGWVQEALQTEVVENQDVDLSLLIGRKAKVVIGARTYQPKDKQTKEPMVNPDGTPVERVYNFVDQLMRIPGSGVPSPAEQPF